jgi:hypothetical protein
VNVDACSVDLHTARGGLCMTKYVSIFWIRTKFGNLNIKGITESKFLFKRLLFHLPYHFSCPFFCIPPEKHHRIQMLFLLFALGFTFATSCRQVKKGIIWFEHNLHLDVWRLDMLRSIWYDLESKWSPKASLYCGAKWRNM